MQIPLPDNPTMFALPPEEQRRNLEEFRRKSSILLTNQERDYLHDILKQYQTCRDVQRLMVGLCNALDTPRKLDLLREIRNLVPLSHQALFDQIAPYAKMMHPYRPVGIIMDSYHASGGRKKADPWSLRNDRHEGPRRSTEEPGSTRMIAFERDYGRELGFGIKSCPGRRPGVMVSHVVTGSQAERNGLKAGVQILEVNNIDFEKITVASALLVLQGSDRLRMKIMYAKLTQHREKPQPAPTDHASITTWIDTVQRKKVSADYKDQVSRIDGTMPLTSGDERRLVLQLNEHHRYIGFNIRGGSEYGLGIYVSRVDKGGLAEANGIRVGDQITNVNGNNFEQITHSQAVDHIKNQRHLIITIRSVNRYPAYKEKTGDEGKELWEPRKDQREIKRREKTSTSSRPASVHLPITEVKPNSKPFSEVKPKQPTAEIKPLPSKVIESKPPLPAFNKSKPTTSQAIKPISTHFNTSNPVIKTTTPQIESGTDFRLIEKLEQSIQTEPNRSSERGVLERKSLSPIPEVIRQNSIATQTLEVREPSPEEVPPVNESISPVPERERPTGPTMRSSKDVIANTTLLSPARKLGRSMSMKVPGEKVMQMFDDDTGDFEKPRKGKKVQRNRTFREILFGIKVKHKDKEQYIGKEKHREKKERKTRKKDSVAGATRKHSGMLAVLKKNKSKDGMEDDRISKADSTYSGGSISGDGSSMAGSSIQGSVGKERGVFIQGAGTQIMHSYTADVSGMALLSDRAKTLLNEDEVKAIIRHVKRYHQQGDIEGLVEPLLAILDEPEKIQLLREVRGVILATDVGRFDSMVSRREMEAQEQLKAGKHENKKAPRDYLARSPSQRRKTPLDTKPDQHGNFYLQDQNDTINEQHLQDELDSLKRWVEKEEQLQNNNAGDSPDGGHTMSASPNQRRHGVSNLQVPSKSSIMRRHSDNATGREAMQRNLKLNGLESTSNAKSTVVKPTSPPPPPPQLLPKPVIKGPPRTPPKSIFRPNSPIKPATPPRIMSSPSCSFPVASIKRRPSSPTKAVPPVLSLERPSVLPEPTTPTKAVPLIPPSPSESAPLSPSIESRPLSPPAHYSTSTPIPTCLPPPPPDSTFSPTLSPPKSPVPIDDLPPPPPPDPIPHLDDGSPPSLPPPPPVESLSPPPPPMATHPYNISLSPTPSLLRDSPPPPPPVLPPPPPPVSPPPPPQLSPESLLVAQTLNNITCDENITDSSEHIYSEIRFNNMDAEGDDKNLQASQDNIGQDSIQKALQFNVPPTQEAQFPNICVSEAEDDDESVDSEDDVELPEMSDDSNDSDSSEEDSDNDNKKTYKYSLIEEEDEDQLESDSSFDTTSPSPDFNRSLSAPPILKTKSPSPAPPSLNPTSPSPAPPILDTTSPSPDFNGNKEKEEPIYATVDKTRKTSRQDTLTVEMEKPEIEEMEEEVTSTRRPSRVSFGEYRASPTPPRKGILKNSFNRQDGARPIIQIRSRVPDYISISSDEDEPSPLKEITTYAKRRAQEELLRPADDTTPSNSPKQGRKAVTVQLSKFRQSLGISIAGGRESQGHPMVRIDKVYPGGAAADNGSLKPGYEVLEVDGTPLTSSTHSEAVDIIRRSYNDKSKPKIEFVVIPYE